MLKVLFLGDVQAKPGRTVVKELLPDLKAKHNIDFVIANGENLAAGFGMTHSTLKEMYDAGVDCITLGNHMFDQRTEYESVLEMDRKVVRPANFTKDVGGQGFRTFNVGDKKIGVLNLYGSVWMPQKAGCPFEYSRNFVKDYRLGTDYDALIVDFHAEPTAEKQTLGHVWDGYASLFVGTHTHTPTADTRIQPKGTGYQTDAGMCGFYHSSLGATFETSLKRFESSRGGRLESAAGEGTLCGVYVEINDKGLCERIERISLGGVIAQKGIE